MQGLWWTWPARTRGPGEGLRQPDDGAALPRPRALGGSTCQHNDQHGLPETAWPPPRSSEEASSSRGDSGPPGPVRPSRHHTPTPGLCAAQGHCGISSPGPPPDSGACSPPTRLSGRPGLTWLEAAGGRAAEGSPGRWARSPSGPETPRVQLRPGQALGAGAVTGPREHARVGTGGPPGSWGLLTVKARETGPRTAWSRVSPGGVGMAWQVPQPLGPPGSLCSAER